MDVNIPLTNKSFLENKIFKSDIPAVVVFSTERCPACKALLSKLERFLPDYKGQLAFFKILCNENASLSDKFGIKSVPSLLVFNNGSVLSKRLVGNVSSHEISQFLNSLIKINLEKKQIKRIFSDVLIIGGGPAGLSSAIYSAREGLKTVLIDEALPGGKLLFTDIIANYPGTKGSIKGKELAKNMLNQAESFGTQVYSLQSIRDIFITSNFKRLSTEDCVYETKAVIIATGTQPRRLQSEGEQTFYGKGVHYCSICDGPLYKNKNVVVLGGGNSALKEALFLSKYVAHLSIVHQFNSFQASKIVEDELKKAKNVQYILNTEVRKFLGEKTLSGILVQNTLYGSFSEIKTDGVFVYIGLIPKTDFLKNQILLDDTGYIIVDENMKSSINGVFAAGDVRKKHIRQITTAISDGTIAALSAFEYINSLI